MTAPPVEHAISAAGAGPLANAPRTRAITRHIALGATLAAACAAAVVIAPHADPGVARAGIVGLSMGIAFLGLARGGLRLAPAVGVGVLAGAWSLGPATAIALAVSQTLAATAGVLLYRRLRGSRDGFAAIDDVLALAVAALIVPLVTVFTGMFALGAGRPFPGTAAAAAAAAWWLGDALGILIIAPLGLVWDAAAARRVTRARWIELALLAAMMLVVVQSLGASWTGIETIGRLRPYAVFPLVVWAALRFSVPGVVMVNAAFLASLGWRALAAPAGAAGFAGTTIHLQAFIAVIALTDLLLGAALAERDRAARALAGATLELEDRVQVRTGELTGVNRRLGRMLDELRESESNLRVSEERFRNLVDGVREYAISMLDPGGLITSWNAGGERITGYSAADILGRHVSCFYTPEEIAVGKPGEHLEAARRAPIEYEGWLVRRDGTRFWANVVLAAVHGADGALIGFTTVTRDLTDRQRLDQELRRAVADRTTELWHANYELKHEIAERALIERKLALQTDELARSNADLERFALLASHDLQSPLNTVLSFVGLLRQDEHRERMSQDARDFVDHIHERATWMLAMTAGLLQYSRIGKPQLVLEPVSADEALEQAIRNLEFSIETTGARIEREPLPVVTCDAGQLTQVFQNLISNAIKFHGPQPPLVEVGAERAEDGWRFRVRDHGIGMRPHDLELIFTIFKRLHGTSSYPGTGVGLAICRRIVEGYGGRIWAESPGDGATFHFTIPDPRPAPAAFEPPAANGT